MLVNCNLWNEKTYKLWGGEKKKRKKICYFWCWKLTMLLFIWSMVAWFIVFNSTTYAVFMFLHFIKNIQLYGKEIWTTAWGESGGLSWNISYIQDLSMKTHTTNDAGNLSKISTGCLHLAPYVTKFSDVNKIFQPENSHEFSFCLEILKIFCRLSHVVAQIFTCNFHWIPIKFRVPQVICCLKTFDKM